LRVWREVVTLKSRIFMNARLREGINLFNQRRFFEAHETWEILYQDAEKNDKPFLEGLIQLSAACRLIDDFGEIKGPVKLIYQALIRFENYQPAYLDVKVADLAAAMEAWAKELEASGVRGQKPVPSIAVRRFGFF
jgi:predicted metal-dependent hydrolase